MTRPTRSGARRSSSHVRHLQEALGDWTPESERPADLVATSALLGLGAPGNIAWRALKRLRRTGDAVTELGHWRAAAILASGLRSLFARPNAMLLLDGLYGGSSSVRADEGAYWRRVAHYCIDGGLQAVLDEYIHHLAGESGADTTTDEGLISLAATARRAIAVRESVNRATDIDHFDGEGIAFPSRFAMRFGSTRYSQDEARLPEGKGCLQLAVLAVRARNHLDRPRRSGLPLVVPFGSPLGPSRATRSTSSSARAGWIGTRGTRSERTWRPRTDRSRWRQESATRGPRSSKPPQREEDDGLGDLSPYWIYPGDAQLQRRIMAFPLSRDEKRWDRLQESLALYRLAFGQPRQEDMLAVLQRRGVAGDPERIAEMRIDLRPPALRTRSGRRSSRVRKAGRPSRSLRESAPLSRRWPNSTHPETGRQISRPVRRVAMVAGSSMERRPSTARGSGAMKLAGLGTRKGKALGMG